METKETTQPKVTIAVAIYNVPNEYLRQCCNSLLEQTLKEIDILLISDCTSQENLELMQEFKERDERVRIFLREENGGLAAVRNDSIREARGEYVYFLDGDDWIAPDACEKAYAQATSDGKPDIVFWSYVSSLEGVDSKPVILGGAHRVYESQEDMAMLQTQVLDPTFAREVQYPMVVTAWAKLYRLDFLNAHPKIRFPEQMRVGGEDYPFTYQAFGAAKKAVFFEYYGHYYRQNPVSFTKRYRREEWDNMTSWMKEISRVVPMEDDLQRHAFERFCLDEMLTLLTVTHFHPNCPLTYGQKRAELKHMEAHPFIQRALAELEELHWKKSKYLFYKAVKLKCWDVVLVMAKIYARKN